MQDTQPYRRARHAQAERVRRAAGRERRPADWARRLKLSVFVILAVALVGFILVAQRAVAFNDAVSNQSALSMRAFAPWSGARVNILLLGYSDESRGGAFLTDSMNLVSIDRESDTTTMIPIPRDLWVEGVTEVPQNMKINEAFRIGYYAGGIENGADLAAEAVAHVTGLRVDGWISLDFQGFQAMVDAIGGITVDNPTAFTYTWAEEDYLARNFQFEFPAGRLELDGTHALDYARNRYTSVAAESSDFARLVRQQRVLQAIRGEMSGLAAVGKGLAVADSLVGHLHTNLSVLDLAMLAGKIDIDRRLELSEGVTLEATTNTVGQYVLAVIGRRGSADYQPLHDYISSSLTSEVAASVP